MSMPTTARNAILHSSERSKCGGGGLGDGGGFTSGSLLKTYVTCVGVEVLLAAEAAAPPPDAAAAADAPSSRQRAEPKRHARRKRRDCNERIYYVLPKKKSNARHWTASLRTTFVGFLSLFVSESGTGFALSSFSSLSLQASPVFATCGSGFGASGFGGTGFGGAGFGGCGLGFGCDFGGSGVGCDSGCGSCDF